MSSVTIKQSDTAISFTDTLLSNGVPYDLSGSDTLVKFLMKKKGGVTFEDYAEIVDELAGTVSYEPSSDFPTDPGVYRQEWEVQKDGEVLTFPSGSYNEIKLLEDLG